MRQVAVIAVAVAVIMAVVLLTGGVVAESDIPGTLQFFGVTVRTTSAQIFLTGAICTWALLAAAWLLAAGIRRSRERGAELALLRGKKIVLVNRDDGPELGELPMRGQSPGNSELGGLFGFAARPGRLVTDRSGPGGGGNRADPGQNPAEQPSRGQ